MMRHSLSGQVLVTLFFILTLYCEGIQQINQRKANDVLSNNINQKRYRRESDEDVGYYPSDGGAYEYAEDDELSGGIINDDSYGEEYISDTGTKTGTKYSPTRTKSTKSSKSTKSPKGKTGTKTGTKYSPTGTKSTKSSKSSKSPKGKTGTKTGTEYSPTGTKGTKSSKSTRSPKGKTGTKTGTKYSSTGTKSTKSSKSTKSPKGKTGTKTGSKYSPTGTKSTKSSKSPKSPKGKTGTKTGTNTKSTKSTKKTSNTTPSRPTPNSPSTISDPSSPSPETDLCSTIQCGYMEFCDVIDGYPYCISLKTPTSTETPTGDSSGHRDRGDDTRSKKSSLRNLNLEISNLKVKRKLILILS